MADMDKIRLTVADYLAMPETNQIVELIEGEIIVSPPVDRHQEVFGNVHIVLHNLIPNGTLRLAPTGLYYDEVNFFEPDGFWVSDDNTQCILVEGKYWRGGPDLIFEIISPSSVKHDKETKFEKYEQISVREYWIIDPENDYMEAYELRDNKFVKTGIYGPGDKFVFVVLGKEVHVAEILKRK